MTAVLALGLGSFGSTVRAQEPAESGVGTSSGSAGLRTDVQALRADVEDVIARGVQALRNEQSRTGSVGRSQYKVAVTSLAGLAVLGAGHQPRHAKSGPFLRGCVDYLESEARGGYISEAKPQSKMHGHCYAVLFLTQLMGSLAPEDEARVAALVRGGIRVIESAQSSRGGWFYNPDNSSDEDEASITVCALQALRAARNVGFLVDSLRVRDAIRYVKDCQAADGSVAYSLKERGRRTFALTAAAMSTLNAAGAYGTEELKLGIDYLARELARYPRSPWQAGGDEYPYYAALYTAQALYQDGGRLWLAWNPKVRARLAKRQRADGVWESTRGDAYGTALALLVLEVPLGYLPIFQR